MCLRDVFFSGGCSQEEGSAVTMGCMFIANKIMSNLKGKVATTSLKQLLGTHNCAMAVRGFSPCVGVSPNAVGPMRRKRIFIASSNTRASLSLNRCREFVSRDLAGGSGIAAKGVC